MAFLVFLYFEVPLFIDVGYNNNCGFLNNTFSLIYMFWVSLLCQQLINFYRYCIIMKIKIIFYKCHNNSVR